MEAAVSSLKDFIHISNQDFIELQKLCWGFRIQQLLICGALDVLSLNV